MSNQRRSAIILLVAAAILLAVFFVMFFTRPINFINTEAEITRIESHWMGDEEQHDVFVKYLFQGNLYESKLDSYNMTYHVGAKINVLVNPNNPMDVRSPDLAWLPWLLLGLSCATLIGGTIMMLLSFKKPKGSPDRLPDDPDNSEITIRN